MSNLLYLIDSYISKFEAIVMKIHDDGLILDRTAFYPGGGGQPHDTGELIHGNLSTNVASVSRINGEIIHQISDHTLSVGSRVKGVLNWGARYNHMKQHTALHVICGAVYKLFGGLVTGCQIYEDRSRLDFDLEMLDSEMILKIEDLANKTVPDDLRIRVKFKARADAGNIPDLIRTKVNLLPTPLKEIRIVEIVGFDLQADGGTHVARTGEIGSIAIVKTENKGKTRKRMEIRINPT